MKLQWDRLSCGCIKANLVQSGKIIIRCTEHQRLKFPKKRLPCYLDENNTVQVQMFEYL